MKRSQLAQHRAHQTTRLVHVTDERHAGETLQPNHLSHVIDVFLLQQKLAQRVTGRRFNLRGLRDVGLLDDHGQLHRADADPHLTELI